ncbi:TonB-dependent receptor plug domain-containing protein [Gracilimonas sp. Q87]|uniref:TonB-dependent receptor plug domain-containing protein n=1 Tax=Gracilimonas sp. Q87 TaxID=3384766 RepID=UPI0039845BE5
MKYLLTTVLLLLAVSQKIKAQVADTLDLGEVVITASKTPTSERETTKPVTTITHAEIQKAPGLSVSELLNRQTGIMINGAVSSPGKDKSVYLRGAATQYTLILIDGFPVTDPSSEGGAFDLRLLSLENVERIEIVKGSMSTLYGSDAIAGVINIITKKPDEGLVNANAKMAIGSYNTNELSLGFNGTGKVASYNVNLSRTFTKGISEAEGEDFNRDGYERYVGSTEINFDLTEELTVTPFLNYSNYAGDYDAGAFADAENTYEADLINSGIRFNYKRNNFELRAAGTFTDTERKFIDDFGVFNPKANLWNNDIYGVYSFAENVRLLAGFNYQDLNFELDGIDEGSNIVSPYTTLYLGSSYGLNTEFGIRLNKHSEYGTNWSFNISPVYNITEELKVLTSLSSGFKAPTLNELFGPFGANPDLEPQTSLTFDAGLEYRSSSSGFSAGVNYFIRTVEDLISYDSSIGYVNVNEQNDSGVEVTSSYTWPETRVNVYYNYLDGAITREGEEFDNLIRRPDHSFGWGIQQNLSPDLIADLNGRFIGEREDLFFNMSTFQNETVELGSYILLNVSLNYELPEYNASLFASLNNLLDADYQEVYGFNTPGVNFKAGFRLSL